MTKFVVALILSVLSQNAFAQVTVVDARVGMKDDNATFHYAEVFQVRGRWIVPDVGYIDFGKTKQYREWFVGGGYKLIVTKHLTVIEELYFVQSDGPVANGARYVQPWTGIFYTFTSKLGGEMAFFPYIPLDDNGRKQWVVERAKLEYKFTPLFKAGVGYGAYQFGNDRWQHKPFVTTTITPANGKFGSLELWFQKLPRGNQIQLRYELVKK